MSPHAPVAQLDRALPSEGKGHTFESCRVRQSTISHDIVANRRADATSGRRRRTGNLLAVVCYTLPALADLASILDYIGDRSPQGAARIG
jgi:hypothetical protein